MDYNEINNLVKFLTENKIIYTKKDNNKIKYFIEEIENFKKAIPTIEKLDELQKIELELEVKYEDLYELNNYFDPVYIKFKNLIRENQVNKTRKENRKKREKKF